MARKFSFFAAITIALLASAALADPFVAANQRGTVGETDHLGLVTSGVVSRPYYNDYAGGTDKYLTHESYIGIVSTHTDLSVQPVMHWRLITPNLWDPLQGDQVASQPAPFADWRSGGIAARQSFEWGFVKYLQIEYEYGQFGDFRGDQMQRKMHDTIRKYSDTKIEKNEYWSPRKTGTAILAGGEIGTGDMLLASDLKKYLSTGLGYIESPLTREFYVVTEFLNLSESSSEWSAQTRIIRQFNGQLYMEPLFPFRMEQAFGWKFRTWLIPTVKVISPVFLSDRRPQIYLDPVHLNFTF